MHSHWRFFEALDDDLHRLARYIEPVPDNFNCYSTEIARLFLSTCSETDVVLRMICRSLNDEKASSISSYRTTVTSRYTHFCHTKVEIPEYGISIRPWEHWLTQDSPSWWQDYNKVKHQRDAYFGRSSLYNLLAASGGLLVALFYQSQDVLYTEGFTPRFRFMHFHSEWAQIMRFGYTYTHPEFRQLG